MLRNNVPEEKKSILDHTLKIIIENNHENVAETREKLKTILNKEKQAAFKHIKSAYSSLGAAIMLSQTSKSLGIKVLCAGLNELYTGDQRFFKENTDTRSQVARQGGYARRERYLETKKEACRLLANLTPLEGWARELDAFKAILPGIQNFMENNNTRYPAQTSIKRTLRHWIKHDPMISAAIRLAKPIAFNDC